MPKDRIAFGKEGEKLEADFLKNQGYKILRLNYKTKLGEIDIIAWDQDTICFIEVKTRQSDKFGLPQEAVSWRKQAQISKTAIIYLKENKLLDKKARFDVVSALNSDKGLEFNLIKNAFELSENYAC